MIKKFGIVLVMVLLVGVFAACEKTPPTIDEAKLYGVTFVTGVDGLEVSPQSVGVGEKLSKPAELLREGYKFVAWKKNGVRWNFEVDTVQESFELVAEWAVDSESWGYTDGLAFGLVAGGDGYQVVGYTGESKVVRLPRLYAGSDGIKKVIAVADSAFWGSSVESVQLTENVVSIGANAFFGASNLTQVLGTGGIKVFGEKSFAGTGLTAFAFPASTREIGSESFRGVPLTEVTIPGSVETIGSRAFLGANISIIRFAGDSSLVSIGEEAFLNAKVRNITVPKTVLSIGARAFAGNNNLESIAISGSVQSIGAEVVSVSDNLSGIYFYDRVPNTIAFDENWKDWRIMQYNYSANDPGVRGFWRWSIYGTPEVWKKEKVVTIDFSDDGIIESDQVIIELVVPVGESAVGYLNQKILVDGDQTAEFLIDEYAIISYNIYVFDAGADTSEQTSAKQKMLELDVRESQIEFVNDGE